MKPIFTLFYLSVFFLVISTTLLRKSTSESEGTLLKTENAENQKAVLKQNKNPGYFFARPEILYKNETFKDVPVFRDRSEEMEKIEIEKAVEAADLVF